MILMPRLHLQVKSSRKSLEMEWEVPHGRYKVYVVVTGFTRRRLEGTASEGGTHPKCW